MDNEYKVEENRSFFYKLYKKLLYKNKGYKQLILWYLLIIFIGALLLFFPFTKTSDGKEYDINFLDVLFISSSAFSDTGLNVFSISDVYNLFGQLIIFFLIMLGGIGWFTFKYFIITFIFYNSKNRKIESEAKRELGETHNSETKEIIKVAVFSMILGIIIFGIIFGIIFATVDPRPSEDYINAGYTGTELKGDWGQSFWTGFFHANASINNAGFDILNGNTSLAEYYSNYGFQVLTLILFIFGGIGFAVIYDIKKNIVNKSKGQGFKFSLFTKISALIYFSVAFIGLILVYITEAIKYAIDEGSSFLGNSNYGNMGEKYWALTFNTFSTRNCGFSTFDLNELSDTSKGIYILMMFIGSGPGSTAGGIRTTTTAILLIYFFSLFKKQERKNVIFNKKISNETIDLSKKIFLSSLVIVFSVSIIISIEDVWVNDNIDSYLSALFIATSAFGTTGLSIGTSTVNGISTIGISTEIFGILTMIIGQIGVANLIKASSRYDENKLKHRKINMSFYLEEDLNLG
ncbi:MAG: sodium transporter [Candidatus Hepatoplasma vulgare]|nr:MAG: sodium transporter [Candidatus Hepatoplasma sp.]